jgi:hypothetical protein
VGQSFGGLVLLIGRVHRHGGRWLAIHDFAARITEKS